MNNLNNNYNTLQKSHMLNELIIALLIMLIIILIVFLIRFVLAYYVAERGNMIILEKGYNPQKFKLYKLACFLTIFFGVIIAYIFVLWFASALPINPDPNSNDRTIDNED